MFATGEGILTQKDSVTPDGLQDVFATNLFGHFLLVSGYFFILKLHLTLHLMRVFCRLYEVSLQGECFLSAVCP